MAISQILSGYSEVDMNKDQPLNLLSKIFKNYDYLDKTPLLSLLISILTNNYQDAKLAIIFIIIIVIYKYLLLKEGHFAKGSMLPKVEASIKFVENTGKKAIITDLNNLANAINGIDCTEIYK